MEEPQHMQLLVVEINSLYPDYVSGNYWIVSSDGTPTMMYCVNFITWCS